MMRIWMRKPATLGLSLGATMLAAIFGCGGQATDSSDAVVVPDSHGARRLRVHGRSPPRHPPPGPLHPRPPRPTASRAGQGRGLGHAQGPGRPSPATRRQPRSSFEQGKAAKDPEVCAKDSPLSTSGWSSTAAPRE